MGLCVWERGRQGSTQTRSVLHIQRHQLSFQKVFSYPLFADVLILNSWIKFAPARTIFTKIDWEESTCTRLKDKKTSYSYHLRLQRLSWGCHSQRKCDEIAVATLCRKRKMLGSWEIWIARSFTFPTSPRLAPLWQFFRLCQQAYENRLSGHFDMAPKPKCVKTLRFSEQQKSVSTSFELWSRWCDSIEPFRNICL